MVKRELSHTLKNLKFMQRAAQKNEKSKKGEYFLPAPDFPSSSVVKRCLVVVEGDPHPGAIRGRMSFLSFNPSIDKLCNESPDHNETGSAPKNSGIQNEATSISVVYGDCKRKLAEVALAPEARYPKKPRMNDGDNQVSTPNNRCSSRKQKLDWSVLRPPRHQNKSR